jgi:Ca2+-binding RTX toxin-like protein
MRGGAGDDRYFVDNAGDVVIELAAGGADTVVSSIGVLALAAEVEALDLFAFGQPPNALLNGFGNALGNTITVASAGTIAGTARVFLAGLGGADTLVGGIANDILQGGAGFDVLTGDLGADVFRFVRLADQADRITDFAGGTDRLQISATGFGGGLTAGIDLAATGRLISNTTGLPTGAFGQFIFETDTGRLWWDIDGTAPALRGLVATLDGVSSLAAQSIQVVA